MIFFNFTDNRKIGCLVKFFVAVIFYFAVRTFLYELLCAIAVVAILP